MHAFATAPGAGRLASVDGPWPNDTVSYAYDALGRATLFTNATGDRTTTNARGWIAGSKDFGKADQRISGVANTKTPHETNQ